MSELRAEWRCSACGCVFYKPHKMPAPKGWRHSDDTCLQCQRSGEDPADAARKALLDGYCVADAWRIAGGGRAGREGVPPKSAVRKWRTAYVRAGKLAADEPAPRVDRGKQKPKPKPERGPRGGELCARVERELRADPTRANAEVAKALGCGASTVAKVRREGGFPKPKRRKRGPQKGSKKSKAREVLEAEPHRTSREVAEAAGISVAVVRSARREAGISAPEVDNRGRPVGA